MPSRNGGQKQAAGGLGRQSHDIRCAWACWLWTQAACCQQLASVVLLQAAAGGEITTEYVFSGRGKPHHDIWLSRVRWVAWSESRCQQGAAMRRVYVSLSGRGGQNKGSRRRWRLVLFHFDFHIQQQPTSPWTKPCERATLKIHHTRSRAILFRPAVSQSTRT